MYYYHVFSLSSISHDIFRRVYNFVNFSVFNAQQRCWGLIEAALLWQNLINFFIKLIRITKRLFLDIVYIRYSCGSNTHASRQAAAAAVVLVMLKTKVGLSSAKKKNAGGVMKSFRSNDWHPLRDRSAAPSARAADAANLQPTIRYYVTLTSSLHLGLQLSGYV